MGIMPLQKAADAQCDVMRRMEMTMVTAFVVRLARLGNRVLDSSKLSALSGIYIYIYMFF